MTQDALLLNSELIKGIAKDSGLLPAQVASIIRTAPLRYKVFEVKKRTSGMRELAQPAREVKWIQRWLVSYLRPLLPIHSAVSAYEPGTSIGKNALLHARNRYLLKMDFSNFFPSIFHDDLISHLKKYVRSLNDFDMELVAQATLWAKDRQYPLRLCIGAPSSPLLSNSVMFDFDEIVGRAAATKKVTYSRYADDLTFSTYEKGVLSEIEPVVAEALSQIAYPNIALNNSKTVHASRAGRRSVTGLVITPDGRLSVGRDRKRLIRAMAHRYTLGLLDKKQVRKLDGLISFVNSIEPGFAAKAALWKASEK
jgi:hypothetical protein